MVGFLWSNKFQNDGLPVVKNTLKWWASCGQITSNKAFCVKRVFYLFLATFV